MNKKIILTLFLGLSVFITRAQTIRMDFPYLAGKTYDFIIFQGDKTKTITQSTIPADGKFTLTIPKDYAPYTGMCRWLITGTEEGGGLDMVIPGKDFSVSCKEKPNENNIVYTGNTGVNELNSFYKKQQVILDRFYTMVQAAKVFPTSDKNYPVFAEEKEKQIKRFDSLQVDVKKNGSYLAQFLNIVNITLGTSPGELTEVEEKKARNIARYIADELDWNTLYTSGHWSGVISAWISIHTKVLNDHNAFISDFDKIGKKINDPKLYTDFVGKTTDYLTENGKEQLTTAIAPLVIGSGKISKYEGPLVVYTHAAVGTQAPDLILTEQPSGHNPQTITLKSTDFAEKKAENSKTLLMFYHSGCGPCESLLEELPSKYEELKAKGVRIISLSADEDEAVFKNKSKDFLWKKDAYCDYKGMKGINFKNYGVVATPTMVLIDHSGKIVMRTAGLTEMMDYLNTK